MVTNQQINFQTLDNFTAWTTCRWIIHSYFYYLQKNWSNCILYNLCSWRLLQRYSFILILLPGFLINFLYTNTRHSYANTQSRWKSSLLHLYTYTHAHTTEREEMCFVIVVKICAFYTYIAKVCVSIEQNFCFTNYFVCSIETLGNVYLSHLLTWLSSFSLIRCLKMVEILAENVDT